MSSIKIELSDVVINTDEKNNEESPRKTLKSYATKLFSETTIGILSNIISTGSIKRKSCEALILFFSVAGFLYQTITFMDHVLDYPTTVDIEVRNLQTIQVPAFTLCYNNVVKRSLFCGRFPHYCTKPSEDLCLDFPSYCTNETRLVPKSEFFEKDLPFDVEEFLSLGGTLDDFLISSTRYGDKQRGPFMRINNKGRHVSMCYSFKSVANTAKDPLEEDVSRNLVIDDFYTDYFIFYAEIEEMFAPDDNPGIYFALHSPYEEEDPFWKGIFIRPGKSYSIYYTVSEEIMLKEPYRTNCTDYIETWEKNNKTGPRNKKMCVEKCSEDYFMKDFKCKHASAIYSDQNMCPLDFNYENVSGYSGFIEPVSCKLNCNNECKKITYKMSAKERDFSFGISPRQSVAETLMYITVHPGDEQIVTLVHTPKYVNVEIFSAIGGFIGCWLGISFMDITDILMRVVMIGRYSSKRSKCKTSKALGKKQTHEKEQIQGKKPDPMK